MKKIKAIILVAMLALAMVATCACGNDNADNNAAGEEQAKTTLRIGTESVAHVMAESAVKPLEDMGYEVEIVMFDDYFTPNVALDEGSIDANFYQHQPFLDMYNEEKGTDIVMLAPCFLYYGGIYSEKYSTLDELKAAGGTFRVAQDASNQSLDLLTLQDIGLIKLTDEEKDLYGLADIVENPYNFEFVYMDSAAGYTAIDEVSAYIGTSNTMANAGLDPTKNQLYYIDHSAEALGVCVRAEDKDTQWAKDLVTAYTSDYAKQYVIDNTNGANVPVE